MPANVVTQPSRASGNFSDAAGPRSGRQCCREGHELLRRTADSGRCEDCNRWVFQSESVMTCGCCHTIYCSTCCPQARTSTEQDALWDDLLATLGSALRDVERVKVQIANDITFDFERIRSAFNCQNVGHETLSAEQIYVDHAIEQAKGALAACGAPDAADLSSQEVIIGEDCASDFRRRIPVTQEEPPEDLRCAGRDDQELFGSPIAAHKLGAERLAPIDVDLLDLSEDIAEPETTIGALTEAETTSGAPTKAASEGMSDIDLLDFAEPTSAPTSVNEVNANSLTADQGAQENLYSISEAAASKKAEEGALDLGRTRIDMDLLDLAPLPALSTAAPPAQVH